MEYQQNPPPYTDESMQNFTYNDTTQGFSRNMSSNAFPQSNAWIAEDGRKPLLESDNEEKEMDAQQHPSVHPSALQLHTVNSNSSTVNTDVVTVAPGPIQFGPNPLFGISCPVCHSNLPTQIRTTYKEAAYVWCCLIFCFAAMICAWVPFTLSGMKQYDHYCTVCNNKLGSYNKTPGSTNGILIAVLLVGMAVSGVVLYLQLSQSNSYGV